METTTHHHYLLEEGVRIVHFFDYYDLKSGGCTVAYRRVTDKLSNRMVECSVAYCHPGEVFTKKVGTFLALQRFDWGNTVTLPIGHPDDDVLRGRIGTTLAAFV